MEKISMGQGETQRLPVPFFVATPESDAHGSLIRPPREDRQIHPATDRKKGDHPLPKIIGNSEPAPGRESVVVIVERIINAISRDGLPNLEDFKSSLFKD